MNFPPNSFVHSDHIFCFSRSVCGKIQQCGREKVWRWVLLLSRVLAGTRTYWNLSFPRVLCCWIWVAGQGSAWVYGSWYADTPLNASRDRCILSASHKAVTIYSCLWETGFGHEWFLILDWRFRTCAKTAQLHELWFYPELASLVMLTSNWAKGVSSSHSAAR